MFSFQWPWLGLLLPLPLLVLILRRHFASETVDRPVPELLNPSVGFLNEAFPNSNSARTRSSWLPTILLLVAWVSLVGALMRPQWVDRHTHLSTEGYDLMLAVDLSRSMLAMDFTVGGERINRLSVTKGVLQQFIEQRRGDRVGLILFGDDAYMQSPLTTDLDAVQMLLMRTQIGMAGDATAIGDAIGLAVKKLRDRASDSKILILLTDGANTAGAIPPQEAARLAADYNIRVYTIGVGSNEPVPYPDPSGRLRMVRMKLDERLLKEIAEMTGGRAFRATDTRALEQIYEEIDRLEKTESDAQTYFVREPLFRYFLLTAMTMVLVHRVYQRATGAV